MTIKKRPPRKKRRKQHCLAYYLRELNAATDWRVITDLVDDAAHQPKRVIDDKAYETIFWLAQDKLKGGAAP